MGRCNLYLSASLLLGLFIIANCQKPLKINSTLAETGMPATGQMNAKYKIFDDIISDLMVKWKITGAAFAFMYKDQIKVLRGYGFTNRVTKEVVMPNSRFRIASISKPITALAILHLVKQKKLRLNQRAFNLLNYAEEKVNEKFAQITLGQLLHHQAGFAFSASRDIMFRKELLAKKSCRSLILQFSRQPPTHRPGSKFAYSNFGYCILGRIIEEQTTMAYEEFLQQAIWPALGVKNIGVGKSRGGSKNEVAYYAEDDLSPYGSFSLEAKDASGGLIAPARELLQVIRFLNKKSWYRSQMLQPPPPQLWLDSHNYYGLGWYVRKRKGGLDYWHTGSLPGTFSMLFSDHRGFAWVILFNTRPKAHFLLKNYIEQQLNLASENVLHL